MHRKEVVLERVASLCLSSVRVCKCPTANRATNFFAFACSYCRLLKVAQHHQTTKLMHHNNTVYYPATLATCFHQLKYLPNDAIIVTAVVCTGLLNNIDDCLCCCSHIFVCTNINNISFIHCIISQLLHTATALQRCLHIEANFISFII